MNCAMLGYDITAGYSTRRQLRNTWHMARKMGVSAV